jgi:PadR family transcriptional regulator PadR
MIEVIIIIKKNTLFKLEILILGTLLEKDCYGYEISQFIKKETNAVFEIKEGVMYPLLHNLLENHHISSYEQIVNRKIRVYYHIEEKGKLYLKELHEEFNQKVQIIQKLLDKNIGKGNRG